MENNDLSAAALEVLQKVLRTLAAQNRLLLQAGECADQAGLAFHILNHTIEILSYDRAVLLAGEDRRLLGVSGTAAPEKHSALAETWRVLAGSLEPQAQIVAADTAFPADLQESWRAHSASVKGCAVLVVPLGEGLPVLWLERWNGREWREKELESFLTLAVGYGNLWRRLDAPAGGWSGKVRRWRHGLSRRKLLLGAAVGAALLLFPLRLRIVAPCEVVPQEPAAIAAKIDGVVERVLVRPGEAVRAGQTLVRLEPEVILQERKAAQQALKEAYARYVGARAAALRDPRQREALPELANRLKQEDARFSLAEFRARNLTISSPLAGVAVITDPDEWAGRPVSVGERVLVVADPARSRARIYLPLSDRLDFPPQAAVKVILNNDSASSRPAVLRLVAAHASERPGTGGGCFLAEADWQSAPAGALSLGVNGTAVVYGRRVPLIYWLLRKPLAALRGWCGV